MIRATSAGNIGLQAKRLRLFQGSQAALHGVNHILLDLFQLRVADAAADRYHARRGHLRALALREELTHWAAESAR